ncbi:MAG: hypothetical protein KDD47_27605 [Acidobacteria bacterium]|nr:hypothetical protein [Acidobacteriota bacterium]
MTVSRLLAVLLLLASAAALPAEAASISKEFPFKLGEWYELEVTDGPVTIHRIRVEVQEGNVKSKIFRPGNSEFSKTVQIQIEYTNRADKDYDADIDVVWVDAKGNEIDGYRDEEGIDEDERDEMTMTLSTLKYGLEMAKTLKVGIRF